ncbi:hemicentin-2-like [Diorhabda sublineata]|uniref:hemicentin-2-like n=1 Tax=Diorhabda sublineata TaxID=1163346 RepID=UPI0024E0FBFD|nr:hemicentin-2-like [Diorhabda sublineata]
MPTSGLVVSILVLLVTCEAEPATEFIEASDGGSASLPCNLSPSGAPDKVSVVLWYKGVEQNPIYRYDVRGNQPVRWAEPSLQNRYFLRILDDHRAVMSISPTKLSDEHVFHCKVDFMKSSTRITHVNLTIIVPPSGVQVSDDWGLVRNGITTAYAEGASLTLTCVASSGKPLARVSWWRDGELVTDETEYFSDRRKSQSVLKIDKLTRLHLLAIYSCEASNSRLQPPLVVRTAIDMYLRPLEVTLIGNNPEFSAGKRYNITCRCRGSRPPAIITWWKDGRSLEGGIVNVSPDGNTTTSALAFTPTAADNGLILTCKASNQRIPFSEQTRTWMLGVLYPPKVTLTLGHGLNGNNIKEGDDVYFECHLTANPWVYRVWWLRNGERLLSNTTAGIIVSNQTLVLQGVTRSSSGRYCCEATNKEGSSRSPVFHLKIKFEPVCGEGTRKILGAAKDEPLKVECKVDAEPIATTFRWSFNSTPGVFRELTDFKTETGGTSVLTYVPRVAADYGTLQCWGQNDIGSQASPCTFHITPASRPDPPHECNVANVSHHSVMITCKRGFDGGLRQKYVLTLTSGDTFIANLSALASPDFNISNLEADRDYTATIHSINTKGPSKNTVPLVLKTLPAPGLREQRRSTEPNDSALKSTTGPWLYILLAAASTFIIAAAIGAILFAVRRFKVDSPVRNPRIRSPKIAESSLTAHVQPLYTDTVSDDNNPDLIPDAPNSEALLEAPLTPYTITARPSSKRNCATQMPVKPYHVTWAPILQSRNCSTQTPPPHKESSV